MSHLTPNQIVKLEAIQNRSTKYEAVLVNRRTGARFLLCYARKTARGVADYVSKNAALIVIFCGSETTSVANKAAGEVMAVGEWGIKFSGRTQRDAILEGELSWWKAGR